LVASVASKSVVVGLIAFDTHDVFPSLLSVSDVLRQIVVQFFERQLSRSARRVCSSQHLTSSAE